jgi:hypothetical protein
MSPPSKHDPATTRDLAAVRGARAPTLITSATPRFFDSEMRIVPGVALPLRSMLVQAADQHVLISPVGTADELAAVGRGLVTLVAPSLLHHLHLVDVWKRVHATGVWGPPGFEHKKAEIADVHILGRDTWPFRDVLDFVVVRGAPRRNEVVFFHRPSHTLYTADLVFNLTAARGALAPIAYRMLGVHERFAMMRPWRRWVVDRAAFRRSIERILAWDFTRIVVAHGEVVERDARAQLIAALRERRLIG